MKVTLLGFSLSFPASELTTPEQFFDSLRTPVADSTDGQTLSVCDTSHKGRRWLAGVLIRDREARHIAVKQKLPGKFVVRPHELGSNTTAMDFNFFVFNPATARGLYQFYQYSVTINQFLGLVDRKYRNHKENVLLARQATGIPDADFLKLREDANTSLAGHTIVRAEALPKLIEELAQIKWIEIEFGSVLPAQQSELIALASHARHHFHRLTYSKKWSDLIKRSAIQFFANGEIVRQLKKGKLRGIMPSGLEQIYTLANNPDKLGVGEYDDWVQDITLDSSEWAQSLKSAGVIQKLLHTTDEPRAQAILLTPTE